MHSFSNAVVAVAGRERRSGGCDRLSSLGDGTLGHILSFLPAAEAARAAALSRLWRHVFAAVHTLSFREPERTLSTGYQCYLRGDHRRQTFDAVDVPATRFVTGVSAALLGRDRGARAAGAPLRALRVAFDGFCDEDARKAVDAWLSYAAYHAGDALEIDLRLDGGPVCQRAYTLLSYAAEDDGGGGDQTMDTESPPPSPPAAGAGDGEPHSGPTEYVYVTPRNLFSCAALHSLRLDGCWLDVPPGTAALPSLATLHLTRVTGRRRAVEDLVNACPRLADLTLEARRNLEQVFVFDAPLRRLALRCCHELVHVFFGESSESELRAFEYRGGVPGYSLLSMMHPSELSLCTLDFCGLEPADPPEFGFLLQFVGVERLHLTSARLLGRGVIPSRLNFPTFPALRNLELTGMLPEEDDAAAAIAALTRILERTPRLETLSLFFLPEPHRPVEKSCGYSSRYSDDEEEDDIHAAHNLRYDRHATLAVSDDVEIPCLRERTREINLVHYQGGMAQRMLAKFLLRNAPVVGEVCCELAQGPLSIRTHLMEEIKGWVMNKSASMMFF